MSAPTPGQRAYEALHASLLARNPDHEYVPWTELDELTRHADGWYRADLEAAAQAVLNQAFPGLRRQLDEARARELVTAAERDDLAARADKLRDRLTEVLAWFGNNGSGHYARVSGLVLARAYRDAGLPLPDSLSHLAGQ